MTLPKIEWKPISNQRFGVAMVGLAVLLLLYQSDSDGYLTGLDDMNLAFHEAGHLIFGFLGSTLGLYGGTIGQLFFPTTVTVSFPRQKDAAGMFGGVIWFCENLLNIARYAADARAQELPLLGGTHDWGLIFTRWEVLPYDVQIAGVIRFTGYAGMAAAALGLFLLWNNTREAEEPTKES